jgi:hypothetical protein
VVIVFTSVKKNRQAFGAGGFLESVGWSLAGPFRQQAGEIKEEAEEAPRHCPELKHRKKGLGKS